MDLEVLAAAPPAMIRAGVGDTVCRATLQADWLLGHLLRGDACRELPLRLLAEEEERLLAGLGMTLVGGSYSTSQGEHLISHWMELRLEVRPCPLTEADFIARHGPQLGPECWREVLPKSLDEGSADRLNARPAREWPAMRDELARVSLPSERIASAVRRIGAPLVPEAVGWPRFLYAQAVEHAAELRNRYTFLDLARDSGTLNPGALFA